MKRLWLVFAQAVTVLLAAWFVVLVLKPQWLPGTHLGPAGKTVTIVEAPPAAAPEPPEPGSLSAAVRLAAPAVVSINTTTAARHPFGDDPWFRFFFGERGVPEQMGLGSGVIVSPDGYILTNNHVVEDADAIEAVLPDGRHAAARIVGTDPESDLAVLKIDGEHLPVMILGDSDKLQVGDRMLAIGNPFGVGQTVTSGIVSALHRNHVGLNTFENFIQTDAAINPGNSGGALTDVKGRLMGINSAIYSRTGGSLGIGFAIPVNTAKQVMTSILRDGRVVRGWIGVEPAELTPELAQAFGVADGGGVIITGVLTGGPAARAGLRPGDIITAVGERRTRNVAELLAQISALAPGQAVDVTLQRREGPAHVSITPGERPELRLQRQR